MTKKTLNSTVIDNVSTTTEQSRFKSPVFWSAVAAQILSIIQFSGLAAKWGIDIGVWGDIIGCALQVFVAFGVLNNPTNKTSF